MGLVCLVDEEVDVGLVSLFDEALEFVGGESGILVAYACEVGGGDDAVSNLHAGKSILLDRKSVV